MKIISLNRGIFITVLFILCAIGVNVHADDHYKNGRLVKGHGNDIFIMVNGKVALIPNPQVFDNMGLQWDAVETIPDQRLERMERVPLLVKGSGTAAYIIEDGNRRLIPDLQAFSSMGLDRNTIITISDNGLRRIPEGRPIKSAVHANELIKNGRLVRGSGNDVFIIMNGKAALIPNAQVFDNMGLSWDAIETIPDGRLERMEKIPLLLRGSGDAVYRVEDGNRRLIPGPQAFNSMGLDRKTVVSIPDRGLRRIPEGRPLQGVVPATVPATEKCTLVGEFTQGRRTMDFSWPVEVARSKHGLRLHGQASDKYGVAKIDGRCDESSNECFFSKEYVSGQSSGSRFYYSGTTGNDVITGKWGVQKGVYNGGTFTAQILDCN